MYAISELQYWIEKTIKSLQFPEEPGDLYEPVAYMMSIGGKRIRPLLCLLSYNLFNDHINDDVLFPAVGIEIFHGFTLVHDDFMDHAPLRRGRETVYKRWNANTAMLSGDVMCIVAYQYLCRTKSPHLSDILTLFGGTAAQVCEGQQLDMNYESSPIIEEEDYLRMIELKTATLLATTAKIGAIIGGAAEPDMEKIHTFGHCLGMAFQIQDDLLDTYGDPGVFGKNIGGDIVTNKKTFLLVRALKQVKGKQKEDLEYWLQNKEDPENKIKAVSEIYTQLKLHEQAGKAINTYFEEANKALTAITVKEERKEILRDFARQLIKREN